jgi:hypothetical protein
MEFALPAGRPMRNEWPKDVPDEHDDHFRWSFRQVTRRAPRSHTLDNAPDLTCENAIAPYPLDGVEATHNRYYRVLGVGLIVACGRCCRSDGL